MPRRISWYIYGVTPTVNRFLRKSLRSLIPVGIYSWYHRRRHGTRYPDPYALYGAAPKIPVTALDRLFDGIEVRSIRIPRAGGTADDMTLPYAETAALAYVCRAVAPRRILEIGTYVGATALVMAENSPATAEIVTVDVKPVEFYLRQTGQRTNASADSYVASPLGSKVTQIVADSTAFDFSPFAGSFDLVFLDGNHSYDFARRDSDLALRMIHDRGVILWDDYLWSLDFPECAGVTRAVNDIHEHRPCALIAGTRLAILRPGTAWRR